MSPHNFAKTQICKLLINLISQKFKTEIPFQKLLPCFSHSKKIPGELAVHFHRFKKSLKMDSESSANVLAGEFHSALDNEAENEMKSEIFRENKVENLLEKVSAEGPNLIFFFKLSYFADQIIDTVAGKNNFFSNFPRTKEKIMVEYSQPNTHKAFHVGHMRNAALGDCLRRLYQHVGNDVVAVNYFGDEGMHVAKCLWLLRKTFKDKEIDEIPFEKRGEILGAFYSKAVELLDLSLYTCIPLEEAIAVKVKKVLEHPSNPSWKVVTVEGGTKENAESAVSYQVVCGGTGFSEGDVVAYMPVGGMLRGKTVVEKDMKGVLSQGVILGGDEVPAEPMVKTAKSPKDIYLLPEDTTIGKNLTEIGRVSEKVLNLVEHAKKAPIKQKELNKFLGNSVYDSRNFKKFPGIYQDKEANTFFFRETTTDKELGKYGKQISKEIFPSKDESVSSHFKRMKNEVSSILQKLERQTGMETKLWIKTKEWSIDEFKRIYDWLGCHFDHDFYESEVSEGANEIVKEYYEKGVFVKDNGCIGADLSAKKLGFCILQKSDGRGLYATKDLKLAKTKFEKFGVDKSVYVVDISQTFHFKQVFATLSKMGFEKIKHCEHLSYGFVTLPDGKMSSRKGTVIIFSKLVELLKKHLKEKCFSSEKISRDAYWNETRIQNAVKVISVGTIKYGMLNQDPSKDIVFDLPVWASPNGNTCSYLLYQYTRIQSVLRELHEDPKEICLEFEKESLDKLSHKMDRYLLFQCLRFPDVIKSAADRSNPFFVCSYLYDICKSFSGWYNLPEMKIKSIEDRELKRAHIVQIEFVGRCLKTGLNLLGIDVLEKM